MPLHEVGYRTWDGNRTSSDARWFVLAAIGIQLIWRTTWLKRTIAFLWVPSFAVAIGFFFYEQSIVEPNFQRPIAAFLKNSGYASTIGQQYVASPEKARHGVWSALLLVFFRYPQLVGVVLVVGLIAPRQITYDVRTRAFLLIFSRPINAFQYILGKQCIIWFYLALITTIPAMVLYALGVLLSPDLGVLGQTWDLPLRVIASSLLFAIPVSSVALAFAALALDSRYASFAWYATWVMGWAAYGVLTFAVPAQKLRRGQIAPTDWEWISPYHIFGRVEQWCFGLLPEDYSIGGYLIGLFVVTICSWAIVHFRISAVSRA